MKFRIILASIALLIACFSIIQLQTFPIHGYDEPIFEFNNERFFIGPSDHSVSEIVIKPVIPNNSNKPIIQDASLVNNQQQNKRDSKPRLSLETAQLQNPPTSSNVEKNNEGASKVEKRQYQPYDQDEYLIGLGLADITGPAADVNLVSLIAQLASELGAFLGFLFPPPDLGPQLGSFMPSASSLLPSSPRRRQQQQQHQSNLDNKLKQQPKKSLVSDRRQLFQQQQQQQQQPQQPQQQPETRPNPGLSELDNNNFRLFNNLLMGYAKPSQDASGIHLRQFSRSVIAVDQAGNRLVYTSLDNGMIGTLLRSRVMAKLAQEFGTTTLYNETNVMMSATHTHSGPGGFFQYMLYNIPSAGFVSQTLEILVSGTVESIKRAHKNLQPARVYYTSGDLLGASINRSPLSYQLNPIDERNKYKYDTDKTMHLLKFVNRKNETFGILNWFAVHGTSMNNTNHLISSDNKGAAALFLEQEYNPPGLMPGQSQKFISIFAQANEGDVSPNTAGPRCIDTGLPCDPIASTCGNPPKNELCIAFGPGKDMFESTKIIAHHQYMKARELMLDESEQQVQVKGPISFVHEHIDMTQQEVPKYSHARKLAERLGDYSDFLLNDTYHTCQAALGYSFAAGTTDGPGAFDFRQGRTQGHSYWNVVRDLLRRPSPEQVECHKPKPILLDTGEMDFPYTWHPRIVPTQILKWGQIAIVGLPGEFTTMAGRRIKAAVESQLPGQQVILSGLSNIYTSYVTTLEEFALQRYEGASTLYGPHTLQAYINQFTKLALTLRNNATINSNLSPPDLSKSLFSLRPGVIYDGTPRGRNYGDIIKDAQPVYQCGQLVNVTFVSANPRNDLRTDDDATFLKVERYLGADSRGDSRNETVATDASWDTKFIWQRMNTLRGSSKATILWEIPYNCTPGHYVIRHFGANKALLSDAISQFMGSTSVFELKSAS